MDNNAQQSITHEQIRAETTATRPRRGTATGRIEPQRTRSASTNNSQRVGGSNGRRAEAKNYTEEEITELLDLIIEYKPLVG